MPSNLLLREIRAFFFNTGRMIIQMQKTRGVPNKKDVISGKRKDNNRFHSAHKRKSPAQTPGRTVFAIQYAKIGGLRRVNFLAIG